MITTVDSAAGQITFDGSGTAIVNGTHTYTTPGVYAVRTTFYFDSTDLCTVDSRLTVADGTLAVSGLAGASFLQNTPSNTEVAVVSGTAAMTPDLAAEIAWGDGATTPALIVPDTPPDGQCGALDGPDAYLRQPGQPDDRRDGPATSTGRRPPRPWRPMQLPARIFCRAFPTTLRSRP